MVSVKKEPDKLARKLRELRKAFEISQKDLAKEIGTTRSAYSYYETSGTRPKMEVLLKIADFYGVDIKVFFDCLK